MVRVHKSDRYGDVIKGQIDSLLVLWHRIHRSSLWRVPWGGPDSRHGTHHRHTPDHSRETWNCKGGVFPRALIQMYDIKIKIPAWKIPEPAMALFVMFASSFIRQWLPFLHCRISNCFVADGA